MPFRSISVYRGKKYKGKEEIHTICRFFFSAHRIFRFSGFRFKVILLYLFIINVNDEKTDLDQELDFRYIDLAAD